MTPSAAPYIDSQDENHLKRPSTQEWAGKRKRRQLELESKGKYNSNVDVKSFLSGKGKESHSELLDP